MKKIIFILIGIMLITTAFAQKKPAKGAKAAEQAIEMKTMMDSVSYIIGIDIARNLQKNKLEVIPDLLSKGLKDHFTGAPSLVSDEQMQNLMGRFQQIMMAQEMAEKNKKDGEAFLAQNKTKEGVITTASGLQYKIITKGNGKIPTAQDTVVAHYKGTLVDGTEFDNSFKRNEPATFPVTGVIKGWQEALQLMPVGSKWEIYVPSELGYGDQGAGQVIPPGAALIFEIELISIK